MNKNNIYALLVLLLNQISSAFAQNLTYSLLPTNPYKMEVVDLFNMNILNPSSQSVSIFLIGKIEMLNYGLIVEVKSKNILVAPGNNRISGAELDIESLNYLDHQIQQFENQTGTLPPGNYKMCISTGCSNSNCDGKEASFVFIESPLCKEFNIMLPSPLLLNFPKDGAEIALVKPQLTWIPPMPLASQQTLTYKLRLVEKIGNQSPIDAIMRNRPLIEQSGIEEIFLNYPPDVEELDTSKQYAWQVEAYSGNLKIATSEAWYFKFKKKDYKVLSKKYYYPKGEIGLESYSHEKKDTLILVIGETYYSNNKIWEIQVIEESGKFRKVNIKIQEVIKQGRINLLILPEELKKLNSGIPLLFEIKGNDNNIVKIRIILK